VLKVAPLARASLFRHATEVMSPAYYSVMLDDHRTRVELTGTMRSGMLRITSPAGEAANLLVDPNAKPGEGFVEVRRERHEIVGYNPVHRLYQGASRAVCGLQRLLRCSIPGLARFGSEIRNVVRRGDHA
jgi:hypothetical protein